MNLYQPDTLALNIRPELVKAVSMNLKTKAGTGQGRLLSSLLYAMVWLLWCTCRASGANETSRCEICTDYLTNKVYIVEDPVRQVKKHICLKCSKAKVVCSICGLATVPKTQRKLDDGRILCELDGRGAILNEDEAKAIFQEVKRDVQDVFKRFGPMPDTNVTAYLVNKTDFIKEYFRKPSVDNPERLLGLTRSISKDGTNFEHHIYLLSGLLRPEFAAICAHEYTHAWLNERSTPTRTMNKDTIEGFCELIALKYVTAKGYKLEVSRILENEYTRGQVHAMIAAEERYQFYRVIDWIERGVDSWIDKDRIEQVINLKDKTSGGPASVPLWQQTTVRTAVPKTLTLRGISGSGARRFALINDKTLEVGEFAKVRLGSTNTVVRCVAIDDSSVTIEIGDTKERRTLSLSPKLGK
jgi:hypothetical protein